MIKDFNLIKDKYRARKIAIVFISVALLFSSLEFIFGLTFGHFRYENLFAFLFELLANGILILAVVKMNVELVEIALVVLKVFEGTYYPLRSSQRLDALLAKQVIDPFDIGIHILFAIAAFSLLFALIFFCIYKYNNKKKQWDIMKWCIIVSTVMMLASVVMYSVYIATHNGNEWREIFEPLSMTMLFIGMFATCEYVEEDIEYA